MKILQRKTYIPIVTLSSIIVTMDSGAAGLEEIVVTAQKRAETLQDVSVAVSVFSGDELSDFGIAGTQSLQNAVPGLVFSNTSSVAQPYLRGVGTRLAQVGLEPSIATYVDDRYISRPTAYMFLITHKIQPSHSSSTILS